MGSSPKKPESEPVAATPRQSALDVTRAQREAEEDVRNRRGMNRSTYAGETGQPSYNASGVLG